jgi:hypothetical protein
VGTAKLIAQKGKSDNEEQAVFRWWFEHKPWSAKEFHLYVVLTRNWTTSRPRKL